MIIGMLLVQTLKTVMETGSGEPLLHFLRVIIGPDNSHAKPTNYYLLGVMVRVCQPSDVWQLLAKEEFIEQISKLIHGARNELQEMLGMMEVVSELHEASEDSQPVQLLARSCFLFVKEMLTKNKLPLHDLIHIMRFSASRVARPGNTVHRWVFNELQRIMNEETLLQDDLLRLCTVLQRTMPSIEIGNPDSS
jgi:hypothetical protein